MKNRMGSKTLRNLLLSLGVVLVPVVVISLLFTRNPEVKPSAVDWQQPLAAARQESPYPVLAPRLGDGWTATKATWYPKGRPMSDGSPSVGNAWTMAWISPAGKYVGLYQRDEATVELIDTATRGGKRVGTGEVAGKSWQRYQSADERTRALVRDDAGATTVVVGDVDFAALESFAASLG